MASRHVLSVVWLAQAALLLGCNAVIGAEEPEVIEPPAQEPEVTDSAPQDAADKDQPSSDAGAASVTCGDGILGSQEECDDGNDAPGDGCTGCVVDCGVAPEFKAPGTFHCYRLAGAEQARSWQDAKLACEQWGGTLATISDLDEFGVVQNRLRSATWLGAVVQSGQPQWVTGEAYEASAIPPAEGQTEGCLQAGSEFDTAWKPCAEPAQYLCERGNR